MKWRNTEFRTEAGYNDIVNYIVLSASEELIKVRFFLDKLPEDDPEDNDETGW